MSVPSSRPTVTSSGPAVPSSGSAMPTCGPAVPGSGPAVPGSGSAMPACGRVIPTARGPGPTAGALVACSLVVGLVRRLGARVVSRLLVSRLLVSRLLVSRLLVSLVGRLGRTGLGFGVAAFRLASRVGHDWLLGSVFGRGSLLCGRLGPGGPARLRAPCTAATRLRLSLLADQLDNRQRGVVPLARPNL